MCSLQQQERPDYKAINAMTVTNADRKAVALQGKLQADCTFASP